MYNRSTSAAAIQKYDCDATTGHSFSFSAKNSVAEPPGGGVGFQIWPSGCHGEPGRGVSRLPCRALLEPTPKQWT